MAGQEKLMTVEEFWELYAGKPYELVNGRITEMTPIGITHGGVTRRVGALLGAFVDEHGLGEVVGRGRNRIPANALYLTGRRLRLYSQR